MTSRSPDTQGNPEAQIRTPETDLLGLRSRATGALETREQPPKNVYELIKTRNYDEAFKLLTTQYMKASQELSGHELRNAFSEIYSSAEDLMQAAKNNTEFDTRELAYFMRTISSRKQAISDAIDEEDGVSPKL